MTESNLEVAPTAVVSPDARIFPSVRGTKIVIGSHTQIFEFVVIRAVGGKGDITIGDYCYINSHCVLYSGNGIRIGNNVLIAAGTMIMPANHATVRRDVPIREQGFSPSRGGTVIEDDVWIGANCTLLDGAHIKRGAIIMAGSVVPRTVVDEYTVWGGIPARYIKGRD